MIYFGSIEPITFKIFEFWSYNINHRCIIIHPVYYYLWIESCRSNYKSCDYFSCGYFDILRNSTLFPTTFNVGVVQFSLLMEVFSSVLSYFKWTSISLVRDVKTRAPFYDMWLKGSGAGDTYSKVKFVDRNGVPGNLRHYSIHTEPYSLTEMQDVLLDAFNYSRSN